MVSGSLSRSLIAGTSTVTASVSKPAAVARSSVAANPLPAPQATLISALAQGVIGGSLDWKMIGIGAAIGVLLIAIDAALGAAKKMGLPPLAVGIGIYLPMSATFAVVVGAVIGHWYNLRAARAAQPGDPDDGLQVFLGLIEVFVNYNIIELRRVRDFLLGARHPATDDRVGILAARAHAPRIPLAYVQVKSWRPQARW